LVWWKKEYEERIRARGHWMNDFCKLLTNTSNYKPAHRYIAECKTCGKFYFATETKKAMIENLKYLGDAYSEK
jgi:general stress protein 26